MEDSEEKSKYPPIFLLDYDMGGFLGPSPWSVYDYSTKVLEYKGNETLEQKAGPFLVSANSAKYLADIIRIDRKNINKRDPSEKQREILFYGGITIYSDGKIPGTEVNGYFIRKVGQIWTASKGIDKTLNDGLRGIIFGSAANEEDLILRVEGILEGYRRQDEAEREAESRARRNDFELGKEAGEAEANGFGL